VFRAGVDLVTVDATVVDQDGPPVTGLTADDFVLTVDGKPRQIDAFELIAVRTGETADRRLPDTSSNDVAEPARVLLLVIDREHMPVGEGRAALEGVRGLIENLSPRDRLGLVTMPGGGPNIPPTADHQAVIDRAVTGGVVASAPHRDLETPGLPEGEGRRHVVRIDAADDRRRASIDQQVEAKARPLVLAVAFHEHVARQRITELVHSHRS
jgi:hypothetical protein